jgi:hypothetical protein
MTQGARGLIVLVLSGVCGGACGSDNPASADGGGDGLIGCTNDPRALTYTANMQQVGVGRLLTFVLVKSDPAPPVKGTNTWTVKLLDTMGHAVTGASLSVVPKMPDHGHGTSIVPQVAPAGDGYVVSSVYLFMAGLWQVTIQAQSAAGNDTAVFQFCIEG